MLLDGIKLYFVIHQFEGCLGVRRENISFLAHPFVLFTSHALFFFSYVQPTTTLHLCPRFAGSGDGDEGRGENIVIYLSVLKLPLCHHLPLLLFFSSSF